LQVATKVLVMGMHWWIRCWIHACK